MLLSIVRDLYAIPASNTIVKRLFSSSKNTVTARRTNLAAEKINKLLFLQKNLACLRQINEEISISTEKQPKRQLSTTKNEKALIVENREDVTVTTLIKKIKKNDIDSYSLDDKIDFISNITEWSDICCPTSFEPVDNRQLTVVYRSVNRGSFTWIFIKTQCWDVFLLLEKCQISIGITPLL